MFWRFAHVVVGARHKSFIFHLANSPFFLFWRAKQNQNKRDWFSAGIPPPISYLELSRRLNQPPDHFDEQKSLDYKYSIGWFVWASSLFRHHFICHISPTAFDISVRFPADRPTGQPNKYFKEIKYEKKWVVTWISSAVLSSQRNCTTPHVTAVSSSALPTDTSIANLRLRRYLIVRLVLLLLFNLAKLKFELNWIQTSSCELWKQRRLASERKEGTSCCGPTIDRRRVEDGWGAAAAAQPTPPLSPFSSGGAIGSDRTTIASSSSSSSASALSHPVVNSGSGSNSALVACTPAPSPSPSQHPHHHLHQQQQQQQQQQQFKVERCYSSSDFYGQQHSAFMAQPRVSSYLLTYVSPIYATRGG